VDTKSNLWRLGPRSLGESSAKRISRPIGGEARVVPFTTLGFFLLRRGYGRTKGRKLGKAGHGGRTHRKGRLWIPIFQHKILGNVFCEALTT